MHPRPSQLNPLKTKVARRVFLLFVLCALGPLLVFAVYGSMQARRQIGDQARLGLRIEARSIGQALVEHLRLVEMDLRLFVGYLDLHPDSVPVDILEQRGLGSAALDDDLASVAVFDASGAVRALRGSEPRPIELDEAARAHLADGRTLVVEHRSGGGWSSIHMMVETARGIRVQAELQNGSLWGTAGTDADLVVLDRNGGILYSSYERGTNLSELTDARRTQGATGFLTWSPYGSEERAAFREIFLGPQFGTEWTVLTSRPTEDLFAPVLSFQRGLLLTALMTLWIILFASLKLIRRQMGPVELLREATHRMAEGDLSARVEIDTDDELEELGESFNRMAERVLDRTQKLEIASRAKNEFLANMSHELRTPMTAILGYAEQCRDETLGEEERSRYLGIVARNGKHLLRVINDILDVAKIEANRLTVESLPCSPRDVLTDVADLLAPSARAKGLSFQVDVAADVPQRVRTDVTRLRQILLNLVTNAIKFTERGGVDLRLERRASPEGGEQLAFSIRDTGIGMTAEQQAVVFQAFVQADSTTTRRFGGTGLGLSIARSLARLLGGDITCESEPGAGTGFVLTIDLIPAGDPPAPPSEPPVPPVPAALPAGAGRSLADLHARVLVAEDVAVNRKLVAMILQKAGVEVAEVENGAEALEAAFAARDRGEPFDVILMDMQMPVMDGYAATRRLRAEGYLLPIVALTSHSMADERERCLAAGCDEFQSKPIDRAALLEVVRRLALNRSRSA